MKLTVCCKVLPAARKTSIPSGDSTSIRCLELKKSLNGGSFVKHVLNIPYFKLNAYIKYGISKSVYRYILGKYNHMLNDGQYFEYFTYKILKEVLSGYKRQRWFTYHA